MAYESESGMKQMDILNLEIVHVELCKIEGKNYLEETQNRSTLPFTKTIERYSIETLGNRHAVVQLSMPEIVLERLNHKEICTDQ